MRRRAHSDSGWALALALIAGVLLGGVPLVAGTALSAADSAPVFTVDICHPLPGLNVAATQCDLAPQRAVAAMPTGVDFDFGAVAAFVVRAVDRAPDAPDPPPPRQRT